MDRLDPSNWQIDWSQAATTAGTLALALLAAFALYRLAFALLDRLTRASETPMDEMLVHRVRHPIKWVMLALAVTVVAQNDPALADAWEPIRVFVRPLLLGWIAYTVVKALAAILEYKLDAADPVATRSRRTRIAILSRTVTFAIVVITVGLMLLGIPGVRDVGTTLLASAGLAALAIGAAAQPALKSLIAGLQMAITEPLRIGDMVKVDGEIGRVEEIKMSFVTVRTWDERAIIVPTNRFLEGSFENWSRKSELLTGPVFLHLDPIADIAPIRAELDRFMESQPDWDGRRAELLVTDAKPESIEVRIAVSAKTIGELWALRCAVREHMIAWLRAELPEALIRRRLEVEAANARAEG